MSVKNEDYEEICVMMYSLQTLHCRGISIAETIRKTLQNYMVWYEESKDPSCLDVMELHLQAYSNMGYAVDDRDETMQSALKLLQTSAREFRPKGLFLGKRVRANYVQVRGMIGKWKPSKKNPMTIHEVVEDIIEKVTGHRRGHYIYQYHRHAGREVQQPDTYELVVEEEGSYFYDVNNFRFYVFVEE